MPGSRPPAGLFVYQLRVVLRGVSPLIWRRLLVRSDSSIADLHATLQLAFGWSDEHLSPSHGGVTAAIAAAPEADVVFVAHTLFEVVGTVTRAWRRIPLGAPVWVCFWRVPAAEVPRDRVEVARWLYAWWARIEAWIAGRVAPPVPSTDEQ